MVQRRVVNVFADYRQYYLWDRGMTDQAPEDYTADDVRRRIKTGPHVVAIQAERNTVVTVTVEVHDADPGFDPAEWDHIAEASLHVPTGQLQVHESTGGPVADFAVEPGWYRVRSFGGSFASLTGEESSPKDRYQVSLWPSSEGQVQVVKQWETSTTAPN